MVVINLSPFSSMILKSVIVVTMSRDCAGMGLKRFPRSKRILLDLFTLFPLLVELAHYHNCLIFLY
jgi:hypothetical protein